MRNPEGREWEQYLSGALDFTPVTSSSPDDSRALVSSRCVLFTLLISGWYVACCGGLPELAGRTLVKSQVAI